MAPAEAKLKGVIRMQKGGKVQVKDLQNSKELNGQIGQLIEFDQVKLRWGVQLEGGKLIALKMSNLLPIASEVEAAVELPAVGPTPAGEAVVEGVPTADVSTDRDKGYHAEIQPVMEAKEAKPQTKKLWDLDEESPQPHVGSAHATAAPEAELNQRSSTEADEANQETLSLSEEWPALPCAEVTPEEQARRRTGCWWDGGSAAKKFTEQLTANDASLLSVCLVPPKRFNEDDAEEVCSALESNHICTELVASGHILSEKSSKRLAQMLKTNNTLQMFSIGEGSLGDLACPIFDGLAQNVSIRSLDLEHKGLTVEGLRSLASALDARVEAGAPLLDFLVLSRNSCVGDALAAGVKLQAPRKLQLCEARLYEKHAAALGEWISRGVEELDLRDNSGLGGAGIEALFSALLAAKKRSTKPLVLRRLRLDGCAIGDEGLEAVADALKQGLDLEELFLERCELTVAGCSYLADALRGRRLRTLSGRANVIGDEGCSLLARCAEHLDLSATSLSGELLKVIGEQPLVSLELFSNPALGPSVSAWCSSLDSSQWQRLEYLDLTGCALQDAGFECVIEALTQRPDLMPSLKDLLIGANDVKEDDAKWELVDALGKARGGKLSTKWANA